MLHFLFSIVFIFCICMWFYANVLCQKWRNKHVQSISDEIMKSSSIWIYQIILTIRLTIFSLLFLAQLNRIITWNIIDFIEYFGRRFSKIIFESTSHPHILAFIYCVGWHRRYKCYVCDTYKAMHRLSAVQSLGLSEPKFCLLTFHVQST